MHNCLFIYADIRGALQEYCKQTSSFTLMNWYEYSNCLIILFWKMKAIYRGNISFTATSDFITLFLILLSA